MTPAFEAVIGLEVHLQVRTARRVFSDGVLSEDASQSPNSCLDATNLGLPGTLPVINEGPVRAGLSLGLALGAKTADRVEFSRKHYRYPDLPRGYQISQSNSALCEQGRLRITVGRATRSIGISRIHLEEDVAKLTHSSQESKSFIDFNRSGLPLLEIVTQPDLRNPEEAEIFLKRLRQLVRFIGISEANMEKGELRCDANISLRPRGQLKFGTRIEIKNLNSFKFVRQALEYEITRQYALLRERREVARETRGFNEKQGNTYPLRSKETSKDYLFLEEPDLPAIVIPPSLIEALKKNQLPLPEHFENTLKQSYGLEEEKIATVCAEPEYVLFFLELLEEEIPIELAYHWFTTEVFGALHSERVSLPELKISVKQLAELLRMLAKGKVNGKIAKAVFATMLHSGKSAVDIIREQKLTVIRSEEEIDQYISAAFARYPAQVEAFKSGKAQLLSFFIGRIMQASDGRVDPIVLRERLNTAISTTQEDD